MTQKDILERAFRWTCDAWKQEGDKLIAYERGDLTFDDVQEVEDRFKKYFVEAGILENSIKECENGNVSNDVINRDTFKYITGITDDNELNGILLLYGYLPEYNYTEILKDWYEENRVLVNRLDEIKDGFISLTEKLHKIKDIVDCK